MSFSPSTAIPPGTYAALEKEFNRRQMRGEPCEDLARMMVAALNVPWIVRIAPDADPEPQIVERQNADAA